MVARRTVWALGVSQLIGWGISYYVVAVFQPAIMAEMGWSAGVVQGGFALALLAMGVCSPGIGWLIDLAGGRAVMTAGSAALALGCVLLAASHSYPVYFCAWAVLGVAMRMALYDAAFASLARIGGPSAKTAMSQITLLGGLASTVFWPVGQALIVWLGWRGAMLCYAGFALATLPLHAALPVARYEAAENPGAAITALAPAGRGKLVAALLFSLIVMLNSLVATVVSAQMIGILTGMGLTAAAAVAVASLRGIGQSAARLAEILLGHRLHPLDLAVLACALVVCGFAAGLWSGESQSVAVVSSLALGAGIGLVTITRGTLPLVLFDHASYGSLAGLLIVPGFLVPAISPVVSVAVIERFGSSACVWLMIAVSVAALLAAVALRLRFGGAAGSPNQVRPARGRAWLRI
jgi:MFS family permease